MFPQPTMDKAIDSATAAVLGRSESLPEGTPIVRGYEFEGDEVDYDALFASYATTGFQATNFGQAIEIVNHMVRDLNSIRNALCDVSVYQSECFRALTSAAL